MPTLKKPAVSAKPETTTVKMIALVRVDKCGRYYLTGWGDKTGPEEDIAELRDDADNYIFEDVYEEYLIEIEVPAYNGFSMLPRFKMKAS